MLQSIEPQPRIFIVDDDESVRKSLTRLLVLEGFRAEAFSSARTFLDSVPNDATGCLILDIFMPGFDGFSLHQKLRQLGYHLPAIFISAHGKAGDREFALDRGAVGFLQKPFDDSSLISIVKEALHLPV